MSGCAPDHAPEAVQEVAFIADHRSVRVSPVKMRVALAEIFTSGGLLCAAAYTADVVSEQPRKARRIEIRPLMRTQTRNRGIDFIHQSPWSAIARLRCSVCIARESECGKPLPERTRSSHESCHLHGSAFPQRKAAAKRLPDLGIALDQNTLRSCVLLGDIAGSPAKSV